MRGWVKREIVYHARVLGGLSMTTGPSFRLIQATV
jgi:hypothetical protein